MTIERTLAGYRFAETNFGDTLQAVALRELGDAARWVELVAINGLVPPYISDIAAADGVLLSGSQIRIPAAQTLASTTTDPDLVFEVDVALGSDGGIAVDAAGDFDVSAGLDNFKAALEHRLVTDTGELMFHPTYGSGLRRIIGTTNGPTAAALAAAYAQAALAADSRVARVVESTAQVVGDAVKVTAKVQPIAGRAVTINTQV